MHEYQRSFSERIFHALLFEILAIGISTPLAAWLTNQPVLSMGVLSTAIATLAVLWNMAYNWLFDRLQQKYRFERTVWVRTLHAFGFEFGLILAAIPLAAWWLGISLWQALVLDIGLVLFYLPYGFFFNLGYDKIRQRIVLAR